MTNRRPAVDPHDVVVNQLRLRVAGRLDAAAARGCARVKRRWRGRRGKKVLDMTDPFSRTQWLIKREFDRIVSQVVDRRVTHDSGWYCPIPGRPLRSIESFALSRSSELT